MRVLIVDDEVKVCALVSKLIDWEALGLEPAGIIHDGSEALQFIQQHKPEIVITDIRMPGCDGIDLIGQVRRLDLDTRFIIISGYRQFEYASNAIKYGVDDYLLKPLKQKDINNVLHKIIAERSQKKAAQEEKASLIERVNLDSSRLKERFLSDILSGHAATEEMLKTHYGCHFTGGAFALITVSYFSLHHPDHQDVCTLMDQKIKDTLDSELSVSFGERVSMLHGGRRVCLVCGAPEDFQRMGKTLRRVGMALNSLGDIFEDIRFFVAASQPAHDVQALSHCVDQAEKAEAQRLLLPVNTAVEYRPEFEPTLTPEELITLRLRNDLRLAVATMDDEQVSLVVDTVKTSLLTRSGFTGWDVRTLYWELTQLFLTHAQDCGMKVPAALQTELAQVYRHAETVNGLFTSLASILSNTVMDWQSGKSAEESRPIRLARKYIHQHYAEALTLQMLSSEVNLNATYFSSAFKRETNQTFLDYVTQVRIDAAKELLADTEIAISDIAERVGYQDMKYFYKRFKKFTGLSPKDYRKLYG